MSERAQIGLSDIRPSFESNGFAFPYQAIPRDEALSYAAQIDALLEQRSDAIEHARGHGHLVFPLLDQLTHDDRIVDAAAAILGPDVLLWGCGIVPKAPHSGSFVSWHQDLTYWGLDGTDEVAVWLALSPVTRENGCMRFVPGSHHDGIKPHRDTFDAHNSLSRGQVLDAEIDESSAVDVTLEPGQLSVHDGRLFHASGPNTTNERRLGLVIQYIAPSMRQIVAEEDFAQLVRGTDRHGHFKPLPRPTMDYDPTSLAARETLMKVQNAAYFEGAERKPEGASVFVNRA